MIKLNTTPNDINVCDLEVIFMGTKEHVCCVCDSKIIKHKVRIAVFDGEIRVFVLCFNCFDNPPVELTMAIRNWKEHKINVILENPYLSKSPSQVMREVNKILLKFPNIIEYIKTLPHPIKYFSDKDKNLFDWICITNDVGKHYAALLIGSLKNGVLDEYIDKVMTQHSSWYKMNYKYKELRKCFKVK